MKLCKDCKHFERISVGAGWCKHPRADFNVVDGSPDTYCFQARGEIMNSHKTICGRNAKLFEQISSPEPYPKMQPYVAAEVKVEMSVFERWRKRWFNGE